MNLSTLIVFVILLAVSFLAVRSIKNDKKKGKSSCGGSCGACGSQSLCHKPLFEEYKKDHMQNSGRS